MREKPACPASYRGFFCHKYVFCDLLADCGTPRKKESRLRPLFIALPRELPWVKRIPKIHGETATRKRSRKCDRDWKAAPLLSKHSEAVFRRHDQKGVLIYPELCIDISCKFWVSNLEIPLMARYCAKNCKFQPFFASRNLKCRKYYSRLHVGKIVATKKYAKFRVSREVITHCKKLLALRS